MGRIESQSFEVGAGVLVHGGAGDVPVDRRPAHAAGCLEAARAGYAVIAQGGTALDAVQAAARVLEDLPQFNAGTGGALNERGELYHDAAIMNGADLASGAVASVPSFKNPIDVARAVLDDGRHVLVVAEGAALAAKRAGIEPVGDPSSLITEKARLALGKPAGSGWAGGTIGAVARDKAGHVAAATSTGGTVGKLVGRVGDSPIIGAGTLADDTSCALSATGDGEGILKIGLARAIAFSIEAGESAEAAAKRWLEKMEARTEATGGVIIYEPNGRATWARCTETMSWAYAAEGGEASGA